MEQVLIDALKEGMKKKQKRLAYLEKLIMSHEIEIHEIEMDALLKCKDEPDPTICIQIIEAAEKKNQAIKEAHKSP